MVDFDGDADESKVQLWLLTKPLTSAIAETVWVQLTRRNI